MDLISSQPGPSSAPSISEQGDSELTLVVSCHNVDNADYLKFYMVDFNFPKKNWGLFSGRQV